MKTRICLLLILLAVSGLGSLPAPAAANPAFSPAPITYGHNRSTLPIAVQIQNLIAGEPAQTPAPAAITPAQGPSDTPDESILNLRENFGTRALNILLDQVTLLQDHYADLADNFSAPTDATGWIRLQTSDQRHRDRWQSIGHDVLVIVGSSVLVAFALDIIFLPLRRFLGRRQPRQMADKLATLTGYVGVRLIPVIVFVGLALTLLDHNETQKLQRFIVLTILYAVTLHRLAVTVIRVVLMPKHQPLRFMPISNEQARNATRWLSGFSLIIIYGYFLLDFAHTIAIPVSVISLSTHVLGFVLVVMAIILIREKRSLVASFLRGSLSSAKADLSILESLRLWLARRWHSLAIAYLIIGYSITLMDVQNGFTLMLRGTILTLLILIGLRFLLLAIDRKSKKVSTENGALHRLFLIFVTRCAAWAISILAIIMSWGGDIMAFFATSPGQRLIGASFSIGITIVFASLFYEILHRTCEHHLNRRDENGKAIPASARIRTLLPMLRNMTLVVFAAIIGLVFLSEAGVNIAPLLAGAGVVGVAIGFGSQTLVKDFLTGLFIIVENTIAIGDVVKIGDHSGVVEAMSMRTLRLRDNDGSLHILPFSEVSPIVNMTKDFAFAVIDVGVSYSADLEHVMDVIRSVGDTLQQDPVFKRVILEPIEILGIEKLGDSSITLRSRLRTRAGKQWDVKRMFLLRMKQRFDKEGIEIPYPVTTQIQVQQPSKSG